MFPKFSPIAPDFTISVYGSSCNYFFFFLFIYILNAGWDDQKQIEKEKKEEIMRPKKYKIA